MATVEVNFDEKTATITAKPSKTVNGEQVEQAMKKAGYGMTSFKEAPPAHPAGS